MVVIENLMEDDGTFAKSNRCHDLPKFEIDT